MSNIKLLFPILILLLTSCNVTKPNDIEGLGTNTKLNGWKIGNRIDYGPGKGTLSEWIPENENINNWSKIITV